MKRSARESARILVTRMLEEEPFVRGILSSGHGLYSSPTEIGAGLRARLRICVIQFVESGTELGKNSRFVGENPKISWDLMAEVRQKILPHYSGYSADDVWGFARGRVPKICHSLRAAKYPKDSDPESGERSPRE